MNADFDRDIDSLLRRFPRTARHGEKPFGDSPECAAFVRDGTGSRNAADTETHLGVDELSAYAENALPAATRAHYVAHLADCEQCRRIVTGIAMAADVAGALEGNISTERTHEETPVTASGWRASLASFFNPRALRYAMPVLALLVTGTIIYMATQVRQQPTTSVATRVANENAPRADATSNQSEVSTDMVDGESVAKMTEVTPAAVSQATPQSSSEGVSSQQSNESKKTEPFTRASEDSAAPDRAVVPGSSPNTSVPQPAAAPEVATLSTAETRQTQSTGEEEAIRVERRDAAPSPTAAPPVKEAARAADKDEAREGKVEEVTVTGGNKVMNAPPAMRREQPGARRAELAAAAERQGKKTEELKQSRSAAPKAGPDDEASGASARSRRSGGRTMSDSVSESTFETRAVAGRRFRRQGAAWIDTAYQTSIALTNITRGSEQYRALVADEPELQRIVGQLGGEVIVLWKGRAYRFR